MIRRRRPVREIAFSFDSFLDVVANVVGIIIRLILVVWVGARSYSTLTFVPPASASRPAGHDAPLPQDPLQAELDRHRQALAEAQARLLEHLREVGLVEARKKETGRALAELDAERQGQEKEGQRLRQTAAGHQSAAQAVALSLAELREKSRKLQDEIRALEKLPRQKQTLHYYTPVSEPVDAEELMFECRHGRVSFIDAAVMLKEIQRGLDEKGKELETHWRVDGVTSPVGCFRLHYVIERQRGLFDTVGGDLAPSARGSYRYGVSEWVVEPVTEDRGEPESVALAPTSLFRHIVDALDPRQSVVTIWVYPDSFALYRRLRDYLYEHDLVVAGRPLPEGVPITCSRHGSRSRGQ